MRGEPHSRTSRETSLEVLPLTAPVSRAVVLGALTLLLLPAVALAHGGGDDGHTEEDDPRFASDTGVLYGPNARPLTPEARYVEQRNPYAQGSMVVWQERAVGRDWDIMAYNLSTNGPAFPVTLDKANQVNPTLQGPWVAWEEQTGSTVDIVAQNLATGETVRVPDTGSDERGPSIGDDVVYFFIRQNKNAGVLRGYDLEAKRFLYPAGNTTVLTPPSAYGTELAWVEGNNLEGKVRVWDRNTDTVRDVPELWSVLEGPVLGPWGVAFIADVRSGQRGVYAVLFQFETGELVPMRTGWYPHAHIGQCDTGVVWSQFREVANVEIDTVVLWDAYTEKFASFGNENFDPTCSGDWFLYEKILPPEDPDLPKTARIYSLDLGRTRPPVKMHVRLQDGLENGIYQGTVSFRGTIHLGDPRQPLTGLWASIDGYEPEPVEARQIDSETYEWRLRINTNQYLSGQHALRIIAVDSQGTETQRGFTFFTDGLYFTDPSIFDQPLRVPREQSSPFPFNLVDHYQRYRQFYNTILLVLATLIVVTIVVMRWLRSRPRGKPEYVRDLDDEPSGVEEPALPAPRSAGRARSDSR